MHTNLNLPRFHSYNRKLNRFTKAPLPRVSLLESIQETTEVMDQMAQMSAKDREALNKVLGQNEGITNLGELAKEGKKTLQNAGISIEDSLSYDELRKIEMGYISI